MKLLALLLALLAAHTQAYKILAIFSLASHSHYNLAKGIVDALLKAGHEVTWATPYPEKVKTGPNLHTIDVSVTKHLLTDVDVRHKDFAFVEQFAKNVSDATINTKAVREILVNQQFDAVVNEWFFSDVEAGFYFPGVDMSKPHNDFAFVEQFAKNVSDATINTKALREIIINQQFDAVINEWFFSDVEAGFAAVQQVPWIVLGGMVMHPHLEDLVDEVRSITTVPMMMFLDHASMPMTFWQRVSNVAAYGLMWFNGFKKQSEEASRYERHFGPLAAARGVTLAPYSEAKHNISVLLVNSHPAISAAQVMPANVVNIAGYHISETTDPLPKDLQEILDSSKQGVVYFSMGSVLKSEMFPEHTRKALVQIFNELPYTVLWKFEEVPPGLGKNVHVRPWFPQASVLAHPNVKLFITHGGQLSCLEAINSGVPLLAIPVFGDQPNNAARAVRLGYAKKVPFSVDMAPELRVALKEILDDDRYYKKAKFLSKMFNKRLVPPSKLISHYVELAIESKGAYHLRSPSQLYAWYERWMLDFIALVLLLLYVVKVILTRLFRALFSKKAEKKSQGKVKRN